MEDLTYRFIGNISNLGNEQIMEHGFCWSVSENPDLNGPSSRQGPCQSEGEFHFIVTGFSPSTTYYVRAYATLDVTTIYGDELSFTSGWDPEYTVKDVDGNLYKTVQIGEQIWMAENLAVTRYSDNVPIPNVKDNLTWFNFSEESKAYCYYDNLRSNGYWYGALYTWAAAVRNTVGSDSVPSGIQGVCPEGWHLPSDKEWKQLEMQLGMIPEESDMEGWRGSGIGDKMKRAGTQFWKESGSEANNISGFDALPGGYRHGSAEFLDLGITARFWSSTSYGYAWYRQLDYDTSSIYRSSAGAYRGYSVRCVKDN